MTKDLKRFRADELARRIKADFESSDHSRYVFFLGAGCSISSGIPSAAGLVQQWLPKLKWLRERDDKDWETWAAKQFPGYSKENPAAHYGAVIEDLFLQPDARQQEIERLTASKYPGFGYGTLAQLMSHKDFGHRCHAVLTTNFDDLVADALYLYSHKKPLVVAHESLGRFVRPTRFAPLVVKLHGDAHLAPKNTAEETSTLDESLQQVLKNVLNDAELFFAATAETTKAF
jgi:SIR2-like domain